MPSQVFKMDSSPSGTIDCPSPRMTSSRMTTHSVVPVVESDANGCACVSFRCAEGCGVAHGGAFIPLFRMWTEEKFKKLRVRPTAQAFLKQRQDLCREVVEFHSHPDRMERMMAVYGDEWDCEGCEGFGKKEVNVVKVEFRYDDNVDRWFRRETTDVGRGKWVMWCKECDCQVEDCQE